ncbi:MAG: phage tail tape measure protein [Eubacteriales bacterium]|nr:phage tail tape measure protein [Eubacteriales bacterium]
MGRNNTQRYEPVVTLNSKAAENALDGLKIKAKQVREALNEAGKMGDNKRVKELDRELKSIEATQRRIRQQTYDYNTVLRNLNTSSITSLEKTSKALRNEIRQLAPGTQEFITKSKQLDLVRNRLDQLNGRVRETHSWLSRAGNSFNKYFGMATAAVASITGISFALRGAAQEAAKNDDVYSDVMKTTGLLREEVVWLNDEFKRISTRTSREQLNGLARDAGKLGIEGKENVLEFVRAANQINVALSEDLGEGAIRNIGKLAEVFKLTQMLGIEKSFLSIGSAINALGQASTAQEQYLVDFTQRIAGVAYQSGMSIQNVLGFASALDQTGQKVEMSATAFQKFLMKMFSDTTTFANMANMEVSAFSELLRKDVNEAILKVLTSLNEKGGFASLVPIFQDMGLDGARAVSVMSAMATNINLVREAQSLSNKEFALATDLTREYNVKNENMQAQLDKARKKFKDQVIELGEKLSPAFLKSTNASTLFLKAIMGINKEFIYAAMVFAAAIVVVKSWNAIVAIGSTLMTSARLVSLAWSASMAVLQGNTIRAAAAWKMFNASFSASGLGAIITAVTALGYGLFKLITYQSDLTKATKEYYAESQKTKREAGDLLAILEKSVIGSDNYKTALSKLIELYGPYISHLIDEKGNLTDIQLAREAINTSIEQSIGLKIKEAAISKVTSESLSKQANYYEDIVKTLMKEAKLSEDVARIYATNFTTSIAQGKQWNDVVNDLFRSVNKYFEIRPFRQFANEYNKMLSDIAKTENKFAFVVPKDKQTGAGETEAQRKARELKEKADAESAAEAERKRLNEEAEKRAKLKEELFKKELETLDRQEREKEIMLKKKYLESGMKKEEFEALMNEKTISFLNQRNALYIKFNKDNTTIESAYYEALLNLADSSLKKIKESMAIMDKWLLKMKEAKEEIAPETAEDKAFWDNYNQLLKDSEVVRNDFSERSWKARKEKELGKLNEMLRLQMITQEEYEYSVQKLKLESAEDIAKGVNAVVQSAAEFFSQLQERQYSKLEQEKARELALYGDSADARAEIEQKYEKKKLELQQRYADMDMVVKIAQTISAGALAGIQAFAQLGPIAGAVAAAFIGLTTSMSIATIVAQRNAIKNQTVASSDSAPSMSVNGYSDGGFTTRDLSDKKAVGVVHANEWVAPAAMVRSNPLIFASLERQRVSKYSMHSPPKQFASGGYTTPPDADNSEMVLVMKTLIAEIRALKEKPFKGYVLLSDVNASQELLNRMKKEGSL